MLWTRVHYCFFEEVVDAFCSLFFLLSLSLLVSSLIFSRVLRVVVVFVVVVCVAVVFVVVFVLSLPTNHTKRRDAMWRVVRKTDDGDVVYVCLVVAASVVVVAVVVLVVVDVAVVVCTCAVNFHDCYSSSFFDHFQKCSLSFFDGVVVVVGVVGVGVFDIVVHYHHRHHPQHPHQHHQPHQTSSRVLPKKANTNKKEENEIQANMRVVVNVANGASVVNVVIDWILENEKSVAMCVSVASVVSVLIVVMYVIHVVLQQHCFRYPNQQQTIQQFPNHHRCIVGGVVVVVVVVVLVVFRWGSCRC